MLIKGMPLGIYMTNCYIVTDEKTLATAIIDPGDEASYVISYIEENKLDVKCIMLTHGHFDHTTAVKPVKEALNVPVYMHKADSDPSLRHGFEFIPLEEVTWYDEGDTVQVGNLTFEVMNTPGHTEGSVVLKCENALFTGDTLFRDSCGRTDLAGGNMRKMLKSLKRLHDLEGDFEVYPGHEFSTNLERERQHNYYIKSALGK